MPRSDCSFRVGGAGVGYKRHQIFEIARVAHGALDALVGHYSGDDHDRIDDLDPAIPTSELQLSDIRQYNVR
jgi:hypothetical protein